MWPFTRQPSPVRVSGDKLFLLDNDFGTEDPDELARIRARFVDQHLRALPRTLREATRSGTHPAQDHRWIAQARPHADDLHRELAPLGYVNEVVPRFHTGNRVALAVILRTVFLPPAVRSEVPWLYRGFETICLVRGA